MKPKATLIFVLHFLFLLPFCPLSAQQRVNGVVTDEKGSHLPDVSITLNRNGQTQIISFAISDSKGAFHLSFAASSGDTLELKASLLGYAAQGIRFLPGEKQAFSFTLTPKDVLLPDVKIKSPPVWQRKDTLNYHVSEFRQPSDRVIGDIISRLPGMEVTPSGQIKYNGKPINKYYIEGLDLVEDRYGIANNNIPADLVERVQVLENHQPVKVLDSVSHSDRAALNIRLKSSARLRLIGRARLSAGLYPLLGEEELAAMMFRKHLQFINTYKYNNTGLDHRKELNSHNLFDYLNSLENGTAKKDLVAIDQPTPPDFIKRRYVHNNSHVFSANQLIPLNTAFQLRVNAAYANDFVKQQNTTSTKFYLPSDTIFFREDNRFSSNLNLLQTDVSLLANTPSFFLKNTLKYQGWWSSGQNTLVSATEIQQRLSNPFFTFSNDFSLIKANKKYIQEWKAVMGTTSLPQQIEVTPGLYTALLNDTLTYEALNQGAAQKNSFIHSYVSLRSPHSKFKTHVKLGLSAQRQQVASRLSTVSQGIEKPASATFANDLAWSRYAVYNENTWTYETNKLKLTLTIPVNYKRVAYRDTLHKVQAERAGIFINPSTTLMLQLNPHWTISSAASYNRDFGDVSGITNGYILKSYRNFIRNNAPLQETRTYNISLSAAYKNPLKVIFFNVGAGYTNAWSNLLYSQVFNGNLQTLLATPLDNRTGTISAYGRANKYIISWKTNLSFNFNYSLGDQQQLQQGKLVTLTNKSLTVGAAINTRLSPKFIAEYSGTSFSYSSFSQLHRSGNKINYINQALSFNFLPTEKLHLKISTEHNYLQNSFSFSNNYFFLDGAVTYKPKKASVDYELSCQNLLDTKSFMAAQLTNNVEVFSLFRLRGRQFLFKVSFPF